MPGYVPESGRAGVCPAQGVLCETVQWLSGGQAAALAHADLEEQLGERGRELLRRLHQDHLDLRAAREQRLEKVARSTRSSMPMAAPSPKPGIRLAVTLCRAASVSEV